jgi:hypothetical protein
VVTKSFVIGNAIVGIRTNSEACGEWLDATLADYRYADDDPSPYYSLYIAESDGGIGQPFHVLYREATTVLKTFDLEELGRALVADLETHTLSQRGDAIYVLCSPVAKRGVTALAPSRLVSYVATAGKRLTERHGLGMPEAFAVSVDAQGTLGAIPRTLDVPDEAFTRLAEVASSRTSPRPAAHVPAAVDLVLVGNYWPTGEEPVRPISRGATLYQLATLTKNLDVLRTEALRGLAKLLGGARCYELRQGQAADMLERLADVLDEQQAPVVQAVR